MIVCICNGLKDKDIKDICDSCETKQEFEKCIGAKMRSKSCRSCYQSLINSFDRKEMNE